jgi:site-specific recombinase XerD
MELITRTQALERLGTPTTDPQSLRAVISHAVGLLPSLPPIDPHDRYGVRALTVLWLEADKTPHTRRAYFADLTEWLAWCTRHGVEPLQARRADMDAFKALCMVTGHDGVQRPASPATVKRKLAGISSWYKYLQSNDVTERNPCMAVTRPKIANDHAARRARSVDTESAWRDAALLTVLFYTGVRVSAVTSAQVSDLDYDGGHRILRFWKKGGTRDFVPLAPPVLGQLHDYLSRRATRAQVELTKLSGPLFVTSPHPHDPTRPGGKSLVQRDVWQTLRKMAAAAGLESAGSISPHTARRTAGTVLLANDVPVQKVQDLLGHADIRTTRDSYDAHRHKLDSSPVYKLAEVFSENRGR